MAKVKESIQAIKASFLREASMPDANVTAKAKEYGLNVSTAFGWLRDYKMEQKKIKKVTPPPASEVQLEKVATEMKQEEITKEEEIKKVVDSALLKQKELLKEIVTLRAIKSRREALVQAIEHISMKRNELMEELHDLNECFPPCNV